MEKIINTQLYNNGTNYQLLGHEKQTLQAIIMPGQSLVTKQEAVLYQSENLQSKQTALGFLQRCASFSFFNRQKSRLNVELTNDTSSIGYVGLQLMRGKIIVIDNKCHQTKNMMIKENYILAHSSNVQIKSYDPLQRRQEVPNGQDNNQLDLSLQIQLSCVTSKKDFMKYDKKELSQMLKNLENNQGHMLANCFQLGLLPQSELVFLQSQSNFIEKTLGSGERIKLRFECLAAHSPTVKIVRGVGNDFELNPRGQLRIFSQKNKFITLQGPGIVYIDMQAGDRFFKEVQMSLFVVILYCCLYLLMFMIVTFDRIDIARQQAQANRAENLIDFANFLF